MPRSSTQSMLAAVLALFAVVCAGLVPNGFMPGRTVDGGWGLVLCPDGGPAPLAAKPSTPTTPAHAASHYHGAAPHHAVPDHTVNHQHAPDNPALDAHAHHAAPDAHAHHAAAAAHASHEPASDHDPAAPSHDAGSLCVWAAAGGEAGQLAAAPPTPGQQLDLPGPAVDRPRPDLGPRGLAAPPPPAHAPPLKA